MKFFWDPLKSGNNMTMFLFTVGKNLNVEKDDRAGGKTSCPAIWNTALFFCLLCVGLVELVDGFVWILLSFCKDSPSIHEEAIVEFLRSVSHVRMIIHLTRCHQFLSNYSIETFHQNTLVDACFPQTRNNNFYSAKDRTLLNIHHRYYWMLYGCILPHDNKIQSVTHLLLCSMSFNIVQDLSVCVITARSPKQTRAQQSKPLQSE